MKKNILKGPLLIPIVLLFMAFFILFLKKSIMWNITDSLPPGIYYLDSQKSLKRNNLIVFCPILDDQIVNKFSFVDNSSRFLRSCDSHVIPFLKPIAAVEGDTVKVTDGELFINDHKYADIAKSSALPHVKPGTYQVAKDTVWVISQYNPRSFDSRYFGPIHLSQVFTNAKPLFISKKDSSPFCYEYENETKCM